VLIVPFLKMKLSKRREELNDAYRRLKDTFPDGSERITWRSRRYRIDKPL
jgi:hypothetical protein